MVRRPAGVGTTGPEVPGMEDMENLDLFTVMRDGVIITVLTLSLILFSLLGTTGLQALL